MRISTLATLTIFMTWAGISTAFGADVVPEPIPGEEDEAISATMKTALGIGAFLSLLGLVVLSKQRRESGRPS